MKYFHWWTCRHFKNIIYKNKTNNFKKSYALYRDIFMLYENEHKKVTVLHFDVKLSHFHLISLNDHVKTRVLY